MTLRCWPLFSLLLLWPGGLRAETSVPAPKVASNDDVTAQLKALVEAHPKIARLESLAFTRGRNDVWMMELGAGEAPKRGRRPALLVAAGLEGNDLPGTAIVVSWVGRLLKGYDNDPAIHELLESTTFYVFPRVNPDGAGFFFAKPKVEMLTNTRSIDDDHDGLVDEDGPDDLDGDGLITGMRIKDPAGEYILDPIEPRLLIKADKARGEAGAWRFYSEGIDNDHDEEWNEDGLGGVNLNRNFPFNYRFFEPWAGLHQMSEPETRALADFVVAHPNIGIVFSFGAADNLVQTPKSEPGGKRPPGAIQDDDIAFYRELGKSYREALGLKKELTGSSEPGTFADWMYFHRGRLALAARPWSPAIQMELARSKPADEPAKPAAEAKQEEKKDEPRKAEDKKPDAPKPEEKKPEAAKPEEKKAEEKKPETTPAKAAPPAKEPDNRNEEERAFLKWIDQNSPDRFVPWKRFEHPDFPGREVEVGGFAPFSRTVPPANILADLAEKQAKFLTALAGRFPRLNLRKAEVKHLGESVYDITLLIENTGYLPTALAQGELTREVNPTRLILKIEDKDILSGSRITKLGSIPGSGGMKEVRYIIHGKGRGKLEAEVISALAGSLEFSLELKEGK